MSTSRLCIKNLPKYASETRLKEHFGSSGEITDVKICRTRDGKSRQMGFVGFKTVEQAEAAMKYFNNTFMDTARLSIEYARKVGQSEVRPWSKYSEGSSGFKRLHPEKNEKKDEKPLDRGDKTKGDAADAEEDPQLAEFLSLMQPRSKSKMWSNDEVLPSNKSTKTTKESSKGHVRFEHQDLNRQKHASDSDEDDDMYQQLPHIVGGDGVQEMEEDVQEALKDPVVMDEGVSDLEYLKSRVRKWDEDDDNEEEEEEGEGRDEEAREEHGSISIRAQGRKRVVERLQRRHENESEEEGDSIDEEDLDKEEDDEDEVLDPSLLAAQRGDQSGVGTSPRGDRSPVREVIEDDGEGAQAATAEDNGKGPGEGEGHVSVESSIMETGRLFVRNLAYSATEEDLSELFSKFGELEGGVHLVVDKETKKSKGLAYIQYKVPEDAVAAYHALDKDFFQGRLLHILPAKPAPGAAVVHHHQEEGADGEEEEGGLGRQSFKAKREAERKADAGNRAAWNTLFMRADTVAEAIAAHFGVSKSELLDRDAVDLPVRMALGEAQVISRTKAALADSGVDVEKLEAAAAASGKAAQKTTVARSSQVLLVKNLPYSTTEDELEDLFSQYGTVARLVLPSTHTLALVEYLEPKEARAAFKGLAYKKFHHVPLYLEWAPQDIFLSVANVSAKKGKNSEDTPGGAPDGEEVKPSAKNVSVQVAKVPEVVDDVDDTSTSTIYVKNVAFATTDESLRQHFDKVISSVGGTLHSAKIARRKDTDGKLLSMGFGFVECNSEEVARLVMQKLQGSMLDKHKLSLQLSKRKMAVGKESTRDKTKSKEDDVGTKLVVRNVAFEATRKDLMGLFGPFGQLKSCRLPKKFDGSHRGFAFVDFVTKQEAKNALEGVTGTHLYGRRLVVEYAADEEGLDHLRAKASAQIQQDGEALAPAKKRLKKL